MTELNKNKMIRVILILVLSLLYSSLDAQTFFLPGMNIQKNQVVISGKGFWIAKQSINKARSFPKLGQYWGIFYFGPSSYLDSLQLINERLDFELTTLRNMLNYKVDKLSIRTDTVFINKNTITFTIK